MNSTTQKNFLLLLLLAFASPTVVAFSVLSRPCATTVPTSAMTASTTRLYSEFPSDNESIGETERLLLETKRSKDLGLEQRIGATIKKDGLDGIRAAVWSVFHLSNYVIPALGLALGFSIMMNLVGYGYYWDTSGTFVIDSLDHIRSEQFFQMEAARLTATSVTAEALSDTLGRMM